MSAADRAGEAQANLAGDRSRGLDTVAGQVSSTALLLIGMSHICAEFDVGSWTRLVPSIALPVFFVLQWRGMAAIARATVTAAAVLLALLWGSGRIGLEIVEAAVGRASFFTMFIVSLDFLRDAAMTSRTILTSGEMIVRQPPGRRYLMLTVGGHLFGVMLNLGSIHVLGSMARRAIEESSQSDGEAVREIRLRRMTTALLRGFAATNLWAPTSITVAVVLSTLTDFSWFAFLPAGLATAFSVLTFGWLLDRLAFRRYQSPVTTEPIGGLLTRLLPLMAINILLIGCTLTISWLLSVRLILALLLCVPVFAISWMIVQAGPAGLRQAIAATGRRLRSQTVPGLSSLRSEIGIMAGSGLLSVLLVSQADPVALAAAFQWLGLANEGVLAFAAASIFCLALVGINPIITVVATLELLQALPDLTVSSYKLALLGSLAWSLSNGFSPLSATVRLTARNVGRPAYVVGCLWNGSYTLPALAVLCVIMLLPL